MIWLAAIFLLLLMVAPPKLRKFIFVAIVIGAAAYSIIQSRNEVGERRAKTLISPNEINIENLKLASKNFEHEIAGRITNNSAYLLEEVDLKLTFLDCPKDGKIEDCVPIGAGSANIKLEVPPGQTRDFSEGVWTSDVLRPNGRLDWSYQLEQTKGKM